MIVTSTSLLDSFVLAVFVGCWIGYTVLVHQADGQRPHLMSVVRDFRRQWMQRICERETHIADATLLSNLLRGALFFASTTVFILGGLAALLGTAPKASELAARFPHLTQGDAWVVETKVAFLIAIYVFAFFKFTWSAWQYNVLSILVGAMPSPGRPDEQAQGQTRGSDLAEAAASIAALAGDSYNNGIRAYYFSIPLLAWIVDPLLFLATTIAITGVLYRREFHSPMLKALLKARAS